MEEFIDGVEYSVEGICLNGTFHLSAITEKQTSGFPAFYETGRLLPARDVGLADRLGAYTRDVVAALDIDTAPIHAEVKVSGDRVELIEVHTRFAGDLIPLLVERAFPVLLGIALFTGMLTWLIIFASHLAFRRRATVLPAVRLPGAPLTTVLGIAYVLVVLGTMAFVPPFTVAWTFGGPFVVLLAVSFLLVRRQRKARG